ncbi:MAG: lamin tail domain-containing protein, partial [Anaerolineales bacterium]
MQPRGCRMIVALVGGFLLIWITLSVMLVPTSRTTVQAATDAPREVVINEVAWMGTVASASDEWIELYNTTATTLTLDGWQITSNDGMALELSGHIAPQSFYLIERTNDETVANIPADLTTGFGYGLSNSGEILTLTNAAEEVIDTANAGGGDWPAGDNDMKATMER